MHPLFAINIVAMAQRLARYVYAMVNRDEAYLQRSLADLEDKRRERQTALLRTLAAELKYAILPQWNTYRAQRVVSRKA